MKEIKLVGGEREMSKELEKDLREYFNALTKEQLVERMYKTEMAMKQNIKTTIESVTELEKLKKKIRAFLELEEERNVLLFQDEFMSSEKENKFFQVRNELKELTNE